VDLQLVRGKVSSFPFRSPRDFSSEITVCRQRANPFVRPPTLRNRVCTGSEDTPSKHCLVLYPVPQGIPDARLKCRRLNYFAPRIHIRFCSTAIPYFARTYALPRGGPGQPKRKQKSNPPQPSLKIRQAAPGARQVARALTAPQHAQHMVQVEFVILDPLYVLCKIA